MNKLFTLTEPQIAQAFTSLGAELSPGQAAQFASYGELLLEWNEKMNLTAITEPAEVLEKHFLDSCAVLLFPKYREKFERAEIIDVGTGAGFPGLPLKLVFPESRLMLLDSLAKRIGFLDTVVSELKLEGTETLHARAEDGARDPKLRGHFDICVSRAVADLAVLAEYDLPYVRVGGLFVAYKSQKPEEEAERAAKAIALMGGRLKEILKFTLPGTDMERALIVIEKIKETPKTFPRKAGTASKTPIR